MLPFLLTVAFVLIALLPEDEPVLGILAFGLAGLGCSALLPLTISFGQGWPAAAAVAAAGGVIAFYQVGYGIAAFGVGPLQDAGVGAVVAVCGGGVRRRRHGRLVVRGCPRAAEPGDWPPQPRTRNVSPVSPTAPSGDQVELGARGPARRVTEVGAGLRTYSAGGRELLDGDTADAMVTRAEARCCCRGRTGSRTGAYEFDGRRHQLALTEPTARNAIHGLVRWVAWTVPSASRAGSC